MTDIWANKHSDEVRTTEQLPKCCQGVLLDLEKQGDKARGINCLTSGYQWKKLEGEEAEVWRELLDA